MIEYDVVCEEELNAFLANVREKIADGWRPIGGVAVAENRDFYGILYQAMIRETEDEPRENINIPPEAKKLSSDG